MWVDKANMLHDVSHFFMKITFKNKFLKRTIVSGLSF